MYLGKVIGTVVSTRKDPSLEGMKLLVTQPLDMKLRPTGAPKIMVDTVGAGVEEIVIYASGAAARNAVQKPGASIDTAIVGIVDALDVKEMKLKASRQREEEDILE